MSTEDQLAQLQAAIAKSLRTVGGTVPQIEASAAQRAEIALRGEEDFYRKEVHDQRIADMQSARIQREEYARKVFGLVAGWIAALFVILLAQGTSPTWHPFSDKVLIALISSMTINLIGTLVIVLKYIFRADAR